MLRTIMIAAVVGLAPSTLAQPDPAATAVLESARDALLKVENLSYKCEASTKGGLFDGLMPVFKSEVWQMRSEGNWMIRLKGEAEVPEKGVTPFLVVEDGTKRAKIWVDDAKKTVFYRVASMAKRAKSEALNMSEYAWLKDFAEPDPLSRELRAEGASLEGTTEVGGVACDVVLVNFGEQRGQARWFFGAEDHLPRKVERITAGQGIEFRTIHEITELRADAGLVKESFEIATPEGYLREEPPNIDRRAGIQTRMDPATGLLVTEGSEDESPQMPDIVTGLEIGNTAPEVEFVTSAGDKVTSIAMRGNVFVLGFWSSTKLPCKRATPEIEELFKRYMDKRFKLLIATCEEKLPDDGAKFLEGQGATYPIALSADEIAKAYKVDVWPTFYVIGFRGEVVHKEVGYKAGAGGTFEMLDAQIAAYMASSGS